MLKTFLFFLFILSISSSHALKLKSKSIEAGGTIKKKYTFNEFGCSGVNLSPHLEWSEVPKGTKSFAVTVYDPDAPTGSGWWHWTLFNLPASTRELREGASADAVTISDKVIQGKTDYGFSRYGGPCPPKGDKPHRYVFTVYALSVEEIKLSENATGAMVGFNIHQNKIESASFTATFGR